jgi:hypothetical protein
VGLGRISRDEIDAELSRFAGNEIWEQVSQSQGLSTVAAETPLKRHVEPAEAGEEGSSPKRPRIDPTTLMSFHEGALSVEQVYFLPKIYLSVLLRTVCDKASIFAVVC